MDSNRGPIECDAHGKLAGLPPLLFACSSFDQSLALRVLEQPETILNWDPSTLDVNEKHDYGYTALHYACEAGLTPLVIKLLEAGADSALTTSELHLQRNSVQAAGMTPLHLASMHNHRAVVEVLLEAGAEPTLEDVDGNTPLILACMKKVVPI